MSPSSQDVDGPARVPLADRDRIDWHDHERHQLVCPRNGVLGVSTPTAMWTVPPDRAVWVPAGVAHAHRAYGPTDMRAIMFDRPLNPLGVDQPTALAVSPLLREVIVSLTEGEELTDDERDNLERVALDQLRRATTLRLRLPYPADSRLRDLAEILLDDPTDRHPRRTGHGRGSRCAYPQQAFPGTDRDVVPALADAAAVAPLTQVDRRGQVGDHDRHGQRLQRPQRIHPGFPGLLRDDAGRELPQPTGTGHKVLRRPTHYEIKMSDRPAWAHGGLAAETPLDIAHHSPRSADLLWTG